MPAQQPSPPPQALVEQVLICFDAYTRARGARDSLLSGGRVSPREEQRAFDDLRRVIEKLRDADTSELYADETDDRP
ncbi:hypothetical protein ABZ695_03155 [Streptomyces sp. NPDC006976]|uniref:Uncharacterized protein n=1 Tax=Streptomyces castrisilvae TaxID=3033811 RepID=A0ABY9HII5_9ACTN|nr:hypothetical protein [Streptomyces sp. Mut1]WLQ34340.1 hypothetical protein P8A18_13215 [Streptomyces sp. Mut1]